MKNWKNWALGIACVYMLATLGSPARAEEFAAAGSLVQEVFKNAPFENQDGMIIDLIYYYMDEEGLEKIAGKAERTIIPAGIHTISVELQKQFLPHGYELENPEEITLEEDTQELKILVKLSGAVGDGQKPMNPTEKPTDPMEKPTEPTEKPTEPTEKPTEPTEKPTEPTEKPTEPTEKPTEPAEKPNKPVQKPEKPNKKPDPSNPKTGDSSRIGLWISLSIGSAGLMAILLKKRFFMGSR